MPKQPKLTTEFQDQSKQIVIELGEYLLEQRNKIISADNPNQRTDLKTNTDYEADRRLREIYQKLHPNFQIQTEEDEPITSKSAYTIFIDPIDGTIPYATGSSDNFCINIALYKGKQPIAATTYLPARKMLYQATDTTPTTLNSEPVQISSTTQLHQAIIGFDCGKYDRPQAVHGLLEPLIQPDTIRYFTTFGSSASAIALASSNHLNGYIGANLEPWDMAAGALLIQQAGGIISTTNGSPWTIDATSIVGANSEIHKAIIKLITSTKN